MAWPPLSQALWFQISKPFLHQEVQLKNMAEQVLATDRVGNPQATGLSVQALEPPWPYTHLPHVSAESRYKGSACPYAPGTTD